MKSYYTNSRKVMYKKVLYDSKREAQYAMQLDSMIKEKKIKSWTRQIKISLDFNGKHICNMIADFCVVMNDGSVEYHEVKGWATPVYRLKKRILEALRPDIRYVVVK